MAASLPKTTNKIIVFKSVSPILEVLLAFASASIIVLVLPRKKANWLDMGLAQNIFQNLIYSNLIQSQILLFTHSNSFGHMAIEYLVSST